MGMGVEKRVVDPYSIRYYKTAGVFSACRLLFIGEIFSIAFYKELRLNKLEFVYQMFSINSSIKRFICSGLSVLELCPAPSIHFKGILLFRCHALLYRMHEPAWSCVPHINKAGQFSSYGKSFSIASAKIR